MATVVSQTAVARNTIRRGFDRASVNLVSDRVLRRSQERREALKT